LELKCAGYLSLSLDLDPAAILSRKASRKAGAIHNSGREPRNFNAFTIGAIVSAFANPLVLSESDSAIVLERIPLNASTDGLFSEKWLQNALFTYPQCLPVKEIDPHIGELIPICTEFETGAGPADILFVTPTGQIVIVETKLYRNPEARREVVAQILDYAKQLTTWTFEDLVRVTAVASKQGPQFLMNRVRDHGVDEAAFVDGINRSLKVGDFLLLIVGDGIRSGAESLVGFLERYGNLKFGLGLIEVAAYRLADRSVLLLPRILAKTEVLQRTVLIGASGPIEFDEVAASDDSDIRATSDSSWYQTFWSEYLQVLRLDDPVQAPPAKPAKSTNIFLAMPPGKGIAWISSYIAQSSKVGGVYLTFAQSFDRLDYFYSGLLAQKEEIESDFGSPLTWERSGNKIYIGSPNIRFSNLNDETERKRVISSLAVNTNKMVNVFRHRLEAMTREAAG
jgi:hypothetical protein